MSRESNPDAKEWLAQKQIETNSVVVSSSGAAVKKRRVLVVSLSCVAVLLCALIVLFILLPRPTPQYGMNDLYTEGISLEQAASYGAQLPDLSQAESIRCVAGRVTKTRELGYIKISCAYFTDISYAEFTITILLMQNVHFALRDTYDEDCTSTLSVNERNYQYSYDGNDDDFDKFRLTATIGKYKYYIYADLLDDKNIVPYLECLFPSETN